MMNFLKVKDISQLSPMISYPLKDQPISTTWIQVYRELVEWATLFSILTNKDFATDSLIVFDGLLRSKIFNKNLFNDLMNGFNEGIQKQKIKNKRNIFLVGVAKHSKILERYRLAMVIEEILNKDYPAYVEVPRDLEKNPTYGLNGQVMIAITLKELK